MTTIKLKNGSGAPTAGDLVQGEPALDLTNKRLYTEDSVGTVIEVGTNPGTDVTFADNRKAIFGAGSDLQIYHDGSNSFVTDEGTGSLYLRGSTQVRVETPTGENMAIFNDNGAVSLRYNNAKKFETTATGIDVTGTVTADGLTVADTTGTVASLTSSGATTALNLNNTNANGWGSNIAFQTGGTAAGYFGSIGSLLGNTDQDLSAYSTTGNGFRVYTNGNNERLRVTSAGNVGIGTSSPVSRLTVDGATTGFAASGITLKRTGSLTGSSDLILSGNSGSEALSFRVNQSEKARITYDGNVGIGTSSPAKTLDVRTSGGSDSVIRVGSSGHIGINANVGTIEFYSADPDDAGVKASIANYVTGNQGPGGSVDGNLVFSTTDSDGGGNDSPTERMRIDSSGNVGIGTTNPNATLEIASGSGNTDAGTNSPTLRITNDTQSADWDPDDVIGTIEFQLDDTSGNAPYDTAFIKNVNDVTNGTLASGALTFGTATYNTVGGAVERMRIDSSGNVGIGTTSPATTLHVENDASTSEIIRIGSSTVTHDTGLYMRTTGTAGISWGTGGALAFYGSGAGSAERMRIDSSGNLLVGTTDNNVTNNTGNNPGINIGTAGIKGLMAAARYQGAPLGLNRLGNDGDIQTFSRDGTTVGSISVTGSSTSYNTSSDQRLKENIVDAPSASSDIDAIQVRSFDWKADGSHQKYGMVAQELQGVAPEAVSEGATEEDMMGVDYSKLVPMLVKEIQSLRARVAQLETN